MSQHSHFIRDRRFGVFREELPMLIATHDALRSGAVYENVPKGALFDAFHEPLPQTRLCFLKQPSNVGGVSKLPVEIFELIFATLSPSSLDAARCTCQLWNAIIMASSNVLESVIQKTAPQVRRGSLPHDKWLRTLHRQLDVEADLVRHLTDADPWRTRFRQCEINFIVGPMCNHSHVNHSLPASSLTAAKFCIEGTPLAYIITEPTASTLEKSRHIVFYHIGLTRRPHYIGSIPFSAKDAHPRMLSLTEERHSYGWTLGLEIDGSYQYYSIGAVPGFSSNGSPFTFRAIASPKFPDMFQEHRRTKAMPAIRPRVPLGNRLWDFLLPLQGLEVSNMIVQSDGCTPPIQFRLAQHRESGCLYLIYVKDLINTLERRVLVNDPKPSQALLFGGLQCEQEVVSIAYLLPPREDCVHRNVAIAPSPACDKTAQIAVIWQDYSLDSRRSELYLYEAPSESIRNHDGKTIFAGLSAKPQCETEDPGYFGEGSINLCVRIQAKRIRSLHSDTGGVHSFSPLWKSASTAASQSKLEKEAALGGLQILQTGDKVGDPLGTKASYQAIHVWGPDAFQIHLSVFDLSYAGPNLRALPKGFRDSYPHRSIGKANRTLSQSTYYGIPCQCTLHDDGYQVLLPDVRCSAMGAVKGGYSLGWKRDFRPEPAPGTVTHYNPPARVEALERRDEWLKDRIRYMKRAGIPNMSIAYSWHHWPWTKHGVIEKPQGWEDLEV